MIEVQSVTKRYGETLAVDRLSFTVEPGRVTGFVGPNGAGKSTTMRMILGLDRTVRVVILGAGNLGLALADYPGFRQEGFAIVALYDTERAKIGRRSKGGVRIFDITEFRRSVKRDSIDIAVVAVPADSAQGVVNAAVHAGIRAILNFSPGALKVPPGVKLKNVDLTVSLESLSFFLARGENHGESA